MKMGLYVADVHGAFAKQKKIRKETTGFKVGTRVQERSKDPIATICGAPMLKVRVSHCIEPGVRQVSVRAMDKYTPLFIFLSLFPFLSSFLLPTVAIAGR